MNIYHTLFKIKNRSQLKVLESILNILLSPLYNLFVIKKAKKSISKETKKYNFSVCAIFKNEAPFFKEWIEYYKIIGTDHIYLYNNNSTDDFLEVLTPYINEGYITLVEWPKNHAQFEAYEHCYKHFRDETKWIAYFDIDEYLCPLKETDIRAFLKKYEGYPALMIYWRMFGTNGQLYEKKGVPIIEQYTCSACNLDGTGKVIISTNKSYEPTHFYHHHINYKSKIWKITVKIPMINEFKKFIFFPQIYEPTKKFTIELNHYFSKAYYTYKDKIAKGAVSNKKNEEIRKTEFFFYREESTNNMMENKYIYRFLIKLKLVLKD